MRVIRSFTRREGRLTPAQARALERLWPRYGVATPAALGDLAALFGRPAPKLLEIGCGNGANLAAMAHRAPDCDFLGIEVYRPGLGRLLNTLEEAGLANVRLLAADVQDALDGFAPAALSGAFIFFPDPWPKKRHHKRRLVQPAFVAGLRRVLRPGARLYLATDAADYADEMRAVCAGGGFYSATPGAADAPRPLARPVTRYEARARAAGRTIHDLLFVADRP